jgi:corrinoid protein of di/trimethylamine methyltransferase
MNDHLFQKLTDSLIDGDPEACETLTKQAIAEGIEPLQIIERGLIPGMNIVGEKFSEGEYFLPDLIIAANGMKKAMAMLEPELVSREQKFESAGVVVLGTVQGDIHEIGKSLVGTMLTANGFTVHDLGADVPVEAFISKIKETHATLLGMSALLTTTMTVQREVIKALVESGMRDQIKVMVGGAPVTRIWADQIGADGFAEDAMGAVKLAKQLMNKHTIEAA